ncbi:MAG: phosphoesterase, partial [Nonomuraea sp.]|nr:phosphoesterase [Nonomuraea sp.]
GRIFVTTGDLVTVLDITAAGQGRRATVSETLVVERRNRTDVEVEIRFRPLDGENGNGDRPEVRRVDLIVGQVTGVSANLDADTNPTTSVVARFGPNDWRRQGRDHVIRHTLRDVGTDSYLRVRGTSTDEMEPQADGKESPWEDLWFYSNPIFIRVR